ncbi:MAG: LiaF domain-containing protein [Bacteroidota bacterium]
MKNRTIPTSILLAVVAITSTLPAQTIQRHVKRTTEKEVTVYLHSTFGTVNLEQTASGNIVEVYYRNKDNDNQPELDFEYSIRKNIGNLRIEMNPEGAEVVHSKHGEVNVDLNNVKFKPDEWYVKLTNEVPLSIEAELGAGKSDFDFTGLRINELSISTGASSSKIRFDEKNESEIRELQIETGVSKFVAEGLNNANFRKMKFEGGVGSYYLDFSGELHRTVDVNISVGLGSLTIVVPRSIGVRVKYEDSWLSNFTIDDEFIRRKKGTYESENYEQAEGRMDIFIESGLGSVKVKRSR